MTYAREGNSKCNGLMSVSKCWNGSHLFTILLVFVEFLTRIGAVSYAYETVQLLCFWTLSIVLFFYLKHVSETGFCLNLQVQAYSDGPINRASPYLWTPAPTQDRIYCINQAEHMCKSHARFKRNIKNTKRTPHTWGLTPVSMDSFMAVVKIRVLSEYKSSLKRQILYVVPT
jgi:hypothetical protein